jgi:hypothetical protein
MGHPENKDLFLPMVQVFPEFEKAVSEFNFLPKQR